MEPSKRLTVNQNVTRMFPPQGRFTIAAKHHITIAEIYETELVDIEKVRRWGKLVGGDPRRPCSGDARAEGSMCRWGLLETSGGGRREKPLPRAPGCLCSDLGQHLCKTEHCGQQACNSLGIFQPAPHAVSFDGVGIFSVCFNQALLSV